jgi:hypothetical protein
MIEDVVPSLPRPMDARRLAIGLAVLDAATDGRSYTAEQRAGALRFTYDHGSGDWLQLFLPAGDDAALLVGFDHESRLGPYRTGRVSPLVLQGLPAALRPLLETPGGPAEDTFPVGDEGWASVECTFAAWWHGGAWRCGAATKDADPIAQDGAGWLVPCLSLEHWLERQPDRKDVPAARALVRGEAVTDAQLRTLAPRVDVARARALLAALTVR